MGKIEFPRHLYKKDGPIKWNHGLTYSRDLVTNRKEYDASINNGFVDNFEEALYGGSDTIIGKAEEVTTKVKTSPDIDDEF